MFSLTVSNKMSGKSTMKKKKEGLELTHWNKG